MKRMTPEGKTLDYLDHSFAGTDQMESARDFLDDIEAFVHLKATDQASSRERLGLPASLSQKDKCKATNQSEFLSLHL